MAKHVPLPGLKPTPWAELRRPLKIGSRVLVLRGYWATQRGRVIGHVRDEVLVTLDEDPAEPELFKREDLTQSEASKMIVVFTPAVLTALSFEQAAESMTEALRQKLGREPSLATLALALGKSALETARWRSMYCSSYGNIRPNATQSGQYMCLPICNELDAKGDVHWYTPEGEVVSRANQTVIGKVHLVPPGHPASRFLAYANRWDGAFEYVDFMSRPSYAAVFERMAAGDALGMVHQMKLKGYFTALESEYAKGVVGLQREFIGKLQGLPTEEFDPPDEEWENLRAQIIGSSWTRLQDSIHDRDTLDRETEPIA